MEKDCSHLLDNRVPSQILTKALVLLEHQVTAKDVERQLKIIDQFITVSKNGFLVRDLGQVMYLFDLLNIEMIEEPRFENQLAKLLDICAIPPKIVKSSDLLVYALDIQEFFSWLGYMVVSFEKEELEIKALDALYKLITVDYSSKRNHISLVVRKEKARNSVLTELFGELLELADDIIYDSILKVLEVFVEGSKHSCTELLKKGAVTSIIIRLEPTWRHRFPSVKPCMPTGIESISHADIIFEVLSMLLEHANSQNMKAPPKFALWSLQWALRLFCVKETTDVDRNNVLSILLLLMNIYPDLLSGNLTLSYDIAMLATSRDIVFHPNWTSDILLTTSYEDQSFMALLLMCISYFPNCLSGPKIIEECRVVMGLLKLIGHQQAIKWHQLQACYLIRLALNILQKIIPASAEDFIEDGGPSMIIQLLNKSRECRDCYNYDIVLRSVEILSHFSYKFVSVRDSIAYNGGLECIIPLLEDHLDQPYLSLQSQTILGVGVVLMEQICDIGEVYLILPMIIKYMKRYIEPNKEDAVQNPKLIIIVLGFIWNKVISSLNNSEQFVAKRGVYLILDVMQMSCLPVKLVALGTLIDLCEIVECIPYLITWRKNGQRIQSLLANIFREENRALMIKVDRDGIITETLHPIMGKTQYHETFCICTKKIGNPSIGDMFASCRPKVYCMLQILNYKQRETVEVVDEFYNLYSEDLSVEDEVTLVLAENYLALKLAEEWKELEKEFEKLGLQPVPSDEAIIATMIQITGQWGNVIQNMQLEVLRKHQMRQKYMEQHLYRTIRDAHLPDAWEALCQMRYVARCSERLFRISSAFKIQKEIKKSVNAAGLAGLLHRTFPSSVSISCLFDQDIDIPTDVCEETASPEPYVVSPPSSEVDLIDCCEQESEYISEDVFLTQHLLPKLKDKSKITCVETKVTNHRKKVKT